MPCQAELNALRQAEQALADAHRSNAPPEQIAALTAALDTRQDAYDRCRDRALSGDDDIESLMRDASGRPLGGGAGPPM